MDRDNDEEQGAADASLRLIQLMSGHMFTQLIASAVRFKIPDILADRELQDVDISELTGIGLAELRRYLAALQALRIVEEGEPHSYRGTALSELLRADGGRAHGQALMAGSDYYQAWTELDSALLTGRSAFEKKHGQTLWERLASNRDVAESFTRSMGWNTSLVLDEILGLHDFPDSGVIADLGAGEGALTAGLLGRFPGLRSMVVEQASVLPHTRDRLSEHGLADRCTFIPADIRVDVPAGASLYILKSVIHNWKDDEAVRILSQVRRRLTAGARLLIIETVPDETNSLRSAIRDLTMLVLFGSQDRGPDAYAKLVEDSGMTAEHVATGPSGILVLAATSANTAP